MRPFSLGFLLHINTPFNIRVTITAVASLRTGTRKDGTTYIQVSRSLRERGISATDIAKLLGASRATVYRYLSAPTTA